MKKSWDNFLGKKNHAHGPFQIPSDSSGAIWNKQKKSKKFMEYTNKLLGLVSLSPFVFDGNVT
jgi:hypothetical protein